MNIIKASFFFSIEMDSRFFAMVRAVVMAYCLKPNPFLLTVVWNCIDPGDSEALRPFGNMESSLFGNEASKIEMEIRTG